MQQNVALNFPDSMAETRNIQVAELDWGKGTPGTLPSQPDIILAADCVYFEVDARLRMRWSAGS